MADEITMVGTGLRNGEISTGSGKAGELHKVAHHKKRAFLAAFAETGNISLATKIANVGRRKHYYWLAADREYVKAYEDAREEAGHNLEAEARRRAAEGWEKLVFYRLTNRHRP